MDRRRFLVGSSLSVVPLVVRHTSIQAAQATPDAAADNLPTLELTLTDAGFEIAQPLQAGRYQVTVTNTGTSSDSHFALGKIPDDVTDAQYEAFLAAMDDTADLSFEEIAFVGVPYWPAPGERVSGVIDLDPGKYLLFDPISGRASQTLMVEGEVGVGEEPASDLTVELQEMEFVLPEDATPPPDLPEFVYQPVTAIGILAPQHTSWLDVQLEPGHYLAVCMLPFGTGYPHAMDGMYRLFEVR